MGDEQHRHALLAADALHERRDTGLVRQIEAVERLVEHQQLGPADERLCDQQPLLLAAGEAADRALGVVRRADELDHLAHPCIRLRATANGTPQRAPSSPSRTMSTPRIRLDASNDRRWGR